MPFIDPLRAGYLHDTERDVLGVLVRYPARIAELLPHCRAETFHHDDHRALYQTLAARVTDRKLTDPTTLREAGLPAALALLLADLLEFDHGGSPHRIVERIASLNRLADLRALRITARQLLDDALEPGERSAEQIVTDGQAAVMALGTRHANGGGLVEHWRRSRRLVRRGRRAAPQPRPDAGPFHRPASARRRAVRPHARRPDDHRRPPEHGQDQPGA